MRALEDFATTNKWDHTRDMLREIMVLDGWKDIWSKIKDKAHAIFKSP